MTASPHPHIVHHNMRTAHIVGLPISDFSRYIIKEVAGEAHLQIVHITSVRRTVVDQARIFYNKHIVEGKAAKYKNPDVAKIVAHARDLHAKGQSEEMVQIYLISSIEHIHGGPALYRGTWGYPRSPKFWMSPTTAGRQQVPLDITTCRTSKLAHFSRRVEERCLIRSRGWVTRQSWDLSCPASFTMRNASISRSSSQFSTSSNRSPEQRLCRVAPPLMRSSVFGDYSFYLRSLSLSRGCAERQRARTVGSLTRRLENYTAPFCPPIRRANHSAPRIRTRARSGG